MNSKSGAAALLLLLSALALACAGASAQRTATLDTGRLPRPPVVLVHPFAVSPEDVVVDTFGPQFLGGTGTPSEKEQAGRKAASVFADRLVEKLQQRGIPAERATPTRAPVLDALVVKGQFLTLDEGSRMERMVLGLGFGTQEVRVRAQVYQVTPGGLRRVDEGAGQAHGDRMPGMAGPVAVGAATGRAATTAVISGGMNVFSEVRGTMDARLASLAEKLADRAAEFYQRQGWR